MEIRLDSTPIHNRRPDAHESLFLNKTVWASSGVFTLQNTDVEASMVPDGLGSKLLSANSLTPGQSINLKIRGYISATNGTSSILSFKMNGQNIVASTGTLPDLSNVLFETSIQSTINSTGISGQMMTQGYSLLGGGQGVSTLSIRNIISTGAFIINTTTGNLFDVSYKWGTASTNNKVVITNSQLILN